MKKRIPVITVCCLAAVILGLFLFQKSQQDHFDQEQFDADLAVLRDYYSDDQDTICAIAAWMRAHPTIKCLDVQERDSQPIIFAGVDYMQIYPNGHPELNSLLTALSTEREHHFSWDDHEPQTVVYQTDPSLHIGRYRDGFWTTTYFCFCSPDTPPDSSFFYREELEDGCWLVARSYDME